MDAHLRILLRAAAENRDDAYVWWGKLRSANRAQDALANERDILEIEAELAGEEGGDHEVHLYLTDYRSLYVGHVDEIVRENVIESDPDRVPDYYAELGIACDCWFKLLDVRRIVADDLLSVIEELKKLQNVHYHDKPVSLYGGMVNLPLIVRRADGARFFDDAARTLLADAKLWAQFDAERAGDPAAAGALQRDLRDNLFGDEAWVGLEPSAREFIASAERVFRDHRGDASFDFTPVIMNFAKALELQCGSIVARGLTGAPREARLAKVRDHTVDLLDHGLLTLGELIRVLNSEAKLRQALATRLRDGSWFVNDFARAVGDWPDLRNRAAHSGSIDRQAAVTWRNELVGVGSEGVLPRLARVRPIRSVA